VTYHPHTRNITNRKSKGIPQVYPGGFRCTPTVLHMLHHFEAKTTKGKTSSEMYYSFSIGTMSLCTIRVDLRSANDPVCDANHTQPAWGSAATRSPPSLRRLMLLLHRRWPSSCQGWWCY